MAQFNPYAAGRKVYGMGRDFPTMGPVDKSGYRKRDAEARARKRAVMRRLDTLKKTPNNMMQPDILRSLS